MDQNINRREAIKRTALILGYAVSSSAVAGLYSGCKVDDAEGWKPRLLSNSQLEIVTELADLILPATETPGAKDLLVHRFIDSMLFDCHSKNEQKAFLDGIEQLNSDAKSNFGSSFLKSSQKERVALLTEYDKELKKYIDSEDLEDQKVLTQISTLRAEEVDDGDDIKPFFYKMKELTLLGYFATEEVGEKILSYDPIPGEFNECIDASTVGNQWSI